VRAEERSAYGRFQPRHDLRSLIEVVAAVARAAAPEAPEWVSQRAYDAARTKAGHADAPRAEQTAKRFKLPWAELLAFAFGSRGKLDLMVGRRYGEREQPWLNSDDVRVALLTVARRLGKDTLAPVDYRRERTRMLEKARLSWRHRVEPVLPTEGQIERAAGSWNEALELAGLAARRHASHAGVLIVEALELALEAHGALPSKRQLATFARANDISLALLRRPWDDYLAELRESRDARGKWTPPGLTPFRDRPDYSRPVEGGLAVLAPRQRHWTRDQCLAALRGWLDELPATTRPTQRAYQDSRRERPDLPALSTIQQGGTWSAMVAEARRRRQTS